MPRPGQTLLTTHELRRAIYVDYEGSRGRAPTLLGYLIDDELNAAIIEPCFHECDRRYRAKHAVKADHLETVVALIERAERENRTIISWSEFDYKHMITVLDDNSAMKHTLTEHFRNAIFTSRRHLREAYPDRVIRNDLASMMRETNYAVPKKYGAGLVGEALRLLRDQLMEGRRYPKLTGAAREGWVTVVKHNVHDLKGMRHVLKTVVPGDM
jgi:hypothetical protein